MRAEEPVVDQVVAGDDADPRPEPAAQSLGLELAGGEQLARSGEIAA